MINSFLFWLNGIEEDDPMPFEISNIYFCVHDCYLSFGGCEHEENLALNFDYYPLEAQYFYHNSFEKDNIFVVARHLIEKALQNEKIQKRFKNKNIYLSKYGEKPIFRIYNEN